MDIITWYKTRPLIWKWIIAIVGIILSAFIAFFTCGFIVIALIILLKKKEVPKKEEKKEEKEDEDEDEDEDEEEKEEEEDDEEKEEEEEDEDDEEKEDKEEEEDDEEGWQVYKKGSIENGNIILNRSDKIYQLYYDIINLMIDKKYEIHDKDTIRNSLYYLDNKFQKLSSNLLMYQYINILIPEYNDFIKNSEDIRAKKMKLIAFIIEEIANNIIKNEGENKQVLLILNNIRDNHMFDDINKINIIISEIEKIIPHKK